MRRKLGKLMLAMSLMTGVFTLGASSHAASAAIYCPPMCCNASCTSVRQCHLTSSGCVCAILCSPQT